MIIKFENNSAVHFLHKHIQNVCKWMNNINIRKLCEWQHAIDLFYFERNSYWDLFVINELLLVESFLMVPLFLDPVIFNNVYKFFLDYLILIFLN